MLAQTSQPQIDAPPTFDWIAGDDFVVPMLPALAHRVIEMASDPEVTVARLSAVVSKDQVLASRVLGLANSAYFSPMQGVSTVTDAIIRLGTAAVRNVVITVCFTSRMHDPGIYGTRGRALADHAIGTAYLARLVAEHARVNTDEAFLYGLLHDIGKLVILKMAHDHRHRTGREIDSAELELAIEQRHAMLGGLALRRWNLPETLDDPVMFHHNVDAAPRFRRETAVAACANMLSHRYGFGCDQVESDVLADPVFRMLRIDETWLAATDARAPGLFQVARELLG